MGVRMIGWASRETGQDRERESGVGLDWEHERQTGNMSLF